MSKKTVNRISFLSGIIMFTLHGTAYSQFVSTGEVQFTGEIESTCSIANVQNGSLIPIATNTGFITDGAGSVEISTNGGALVSIGEPSLSSVPTGAGNDVLDQSASSANLQVGNININSGDAPEEIAQAGTQTASVSVTLEPSDSTSGFPTGQYTASVTVTCEFEANPGLILGDGS